MKIDAKKLVVRIWRDWVRPMAVVVIVLFSFRSAVADWNDVPTGSMKPTILEGDRIFVNKLAYDLKVPFTRVRLAQWADPDRGDVVILYSPDEGTRLVKRVIAVPGDQIAMINNHLFVNGQQATYEPLDDDVANQIQPPLRDVTTFANETVDGDSHAIMLTPRIGSPPFIQPMTVPEGQFFVMGGNRNESRDSRIFGLVDRDLIVGEALAVALSFDPESHYMPRWSRWFSALR